MTRVPVLCYHSLDASGSVISMPPETFRWQMHALRSWGYQGLCLGQLLDAWEGKAALPPRPVVLTFDDAFANLRDHAAPVLADLGFRATVFAVAGHCGGCNDWPSDPPGIPRLPLLSLAGLRELAAAGWEIGAHSLTHPRLPRLPAADAAREISASQTALQDGTGQPVAVFAYPYGEASSANRAAAAAHYRAACGVGLGLTRRDGDRYRLRRVEMYYLRSESVFRLFPTPLGKAYLGVRGLGRACRGLFRNLGAKHAVPAPEPHDASRCSPS